MNDKELFISGSLTSFAFITGMHFQSEGLTWNFIEGRLFVGLFGFLAMYGIYKLYKRIKSKQKTLVNNGVKS